ncbi:hypothetical protein ACQ5SO_13875 [Rhodovulum sp. DZ06]|uniref:hypothetical protein n=1 Tax=Rhodovulum sp. DZ06 TaxID=3425126 RepID=UPI003D32B046
MADKTFLLGIGHQKCGTSWLYSYLEQMPKFNGGFTKEYHIWDALDVDEQKWNRPRPRMSHNFGMWRASRHGRRRRMMCRPGYYFDYFNGLYRGRARLTADVTPSYSGLGAERLAFIKRGFAARGVKVKAVILVREPLSRIKSAVRFNLDRGNRVEGVQSDDGSFEEALAGYYRSPHCSLRTRYDATIRTARKVFDEDDLHIGVYETMFTPQEVARVSDVLGVTAAPDYADVVVNKTRNRVEDTELDREIRSYYAPVYDYCRKVVPQTRDAWG